MSLHTLAHTGNVDLLRNHRVQDIPAPDETTQAEKLRLPAVAYIFRMYITHAPCVLWPWHITVVTQWPHSALRTTNS